MDVAGLGGGIEAALEGAVEVCDIFALDAESALLMVPAVWLEYPEASLWRSMGTIFSVSARGLSVPRSEGLERFAATLAPGEERRNEDSTGCSL